MSAMGLAIAATALSALAASPTVAAPSPRVTVLDDGEKIARDSARPLPSSPWPGDIDLFALRGETVAIQIVVEAGASPLSEVHALAGVFQGDRAQADIDVETFAEHFVHIERPSGNDREPGSLAFTALAAPPRGAFVGWFADALVPFDAAAAPFERAAIWVDFTVPAATRAGTYRSVVIVVAQGRAIASRPLALRVIDRELPYAAEKATVYYDPKNLESRMGDRRAEPALRQLFHAHHLSAFREVTGLSELGEDEAALTGVAFTRAKGYRGPGESTGEGLFVIGSYGALGEPRLDKVAAVEELTAHVRELGLGPATELLLYAVDEDCASPWGGAWADLLRGRESVRGLGVAVTCGKDPLAQRAEVILMTPPDLHPRRARIARSLGKRVFAYNGQRPFAGPMMLDVPATDLRANAWIAARYGIERWFYWESTYWRAPRDAAGVDPFAVAETFHNGDSDHANGDGILVYPGTQVAPGMRDFGEPTVFPSVRLKNIRRGVEDAGYIALASEIDREATFAIVRRVVPRALAEAGPRAAWPERGAAWIEARRGLAAIIERGVAREPSAPVSDGCAASRQGPRGANVGACAVMALLFLVRRVRFTR